VILCFSICFLLKISFIFTARSAQDAEDAELEVFSFAVERTAKKINQRLYCCNYMFLYQFILSHRAESNKKNDSLRALRLCSENKTLYVIVFKNMYVLSA